MGLALIGCQTQRVVVTISAESTPATAPLYIGLASTAADLPNLLDNPYPQVDWLFTVNNTTALFADLAQNQLDAILVHDIPAPPDPAHPYWFNPVALDGLVLIVQPDNPVRDLTLGQIQAIFSGRLTNWQMVGGPDLPIIPITRERDSGARAIFNRRVMADQRLTINAVIQPTNPGLIRAVAAQPGAIGYTMMGALPRVTTDPAEAVRWLSIEGVSPNPLTTADQSYPLTTPLYWVSLAEPQGEWRAFLAWLQSEAGQAQLGVRYGRVR